MLTVLHLVTNMALVSTQFSLCNDMVNVRIVTGCVSKPQTPIAPLHLKLFGSNLRVQTSHDAYEPLAHAHHPLGLQADAPRLSPPFPFLPPLQVTQAVAQALPRCCRRASSGSVRAGAEGVNSQIRETVAAVSRGVAPPTYHPAGLSHAPL